MSERYYYGNSEQIRGVEEYRLVEGKANNMRMFHIRNGLGLDITISADRCADISRLVFKGDNFGYFSPTGNVAPTFYDARDAEMVRSFTGGFLTTCGLTNVGAVNNDGEDLPLHGRISNQPASHCYWTEDKDSFIVNATIREAALGMNKLELNRNYMISKNSNEIIINDTIKNVGEKTSPCMILYHMNMAYPLLSEDAKIEIRSDNITGRNERATKLLDKWSEISAPRENEEETCYYHHFKDEGFARIYNDKIKKGVEISYDAKSLPSFTQWSMFGKYDYVLGLEPGNCYPDGRSRVRKDNKLVELKEQEEVKYSIKIKIVEE